MRSWILFSFAAVACGGSVTSVDGNQQTNTLGPADQDQLCLDTYNYVRSSLSTDDIAKLSCGFQADSGGEAVCAQTYASCVETAKANAQQIAWPLVPDCTAFDANVAACNTTVAEYTKCLQQEMDAVKAMEGSFPLCTTAEMQAAAIAAATHVTSDCLQLMQTCTISFAPGTSGSSGGGPNGG